MNQKVLSVAVAGILSMSAFANVGSEIAVVGKSISHSVAAIVSAAKVAGVELKAGATNADQVVRSLKGLNAAQQSKVLNAMVAAGNVDVAEKVAVALGSKVDGSANTSAYKDTSAQAAGSTYTGAGFSKPNTTAAQNVEVKTVATETAKAPVAAKAETKTVSTYAVKVDSMLSDKIAMNSSSAETVRHLEGLAENERALRAITDGQGTLKTKCEASITGVNAAGLEKNSEITLNLVTKAKKECPGQALNTTMALGLVQFQALRAGVTTVSAKNFSAIKQSATTQCDCFCPVQTATVGALNGEVTRYIESGKSVQDGQACLM